MRLPLSSFALTLAFASIFNLGGSWEKSSFAQSSSESDFPTLDSKTIACLHGMPAENRIQEILMKQLQFRSGANRPSEEEFECLSNLNIALQRRLYALSSVTDTVERLARDNKKARQALDETDRYMAANFDAIDAALGALNRYPERFSTREMDREAIRTILFRLASQGTLNSVGGDFLTTLIFLTTHTAKEGNSLLAGLFNKYGSDRSTLIVVGLASLGISELFHQFMILKDVDPSVKKIVSIAFDLLRWAAVAFNNYDLANARLPLVGFKVLGARLPHENGSLELYVYPESKQFFGIPRSTGVGLWWHKSY